MDHTKRMMHLFAVVALGNGLCIGTANSAGGNWNSLKGNWSHTRACVSDDGTSWTLLINSIQSKDMLCAIEKRTPIKNGWYLFLQCKSEAISSGAIVSYMGEAIASSPNELKFELTEYRGANGAPNLNIKLHRCPI